MSNRLGKDSFVDVTKRKKRTLAKTVLSPKTRFHAHVINNVTQSTIPAQIDTSKPSSEETSHFTHVSNKSTHSQIEARFEELMKKREEQHELQMAEQQEQFAAQMADLKSEYSEAIHDHETTIDGLQFTVREKNNTNNDHRKHSFISWKAEYQSSHLSEINLGKQTTFASVDDDDDESPDVDSSAQSVTPQIIALQLLLVLSVVPFLKA